jgi:membrane protease YdiL (CAAX protease family)
LHVVLGGQSPNLPAMIGALPTVLAISVYMFIQVSIGEEIGWRGYALPKLQSGYSALVSSVILGGIWALWHLPLFFNPDSGYSNTPFWAFLIFILPVSILITWIFNSTGGSTLMIMILHAMLNASIGPCGGLRLSTAQLSAIRTSTSSRLPSCGLEPSSWCSSTGRPTSHGSPDTSCSPPAASPNRGCNN